MNFTSPRIILDGTQIPRLNRHDEIQLINTADADPAWLVEIGARQGKKSWWVPRSEDLPLVDLDPYLPRYAKFAVVPKIVDLIPSTSWFASLANMLMASSWQKLRETTEERSGGCLECGVKSNLECHEDWVYDDRRCVQKLRGLMSLCGLCHETYHIGFAEVRGRGDAAFDRLMTINRIKDGEREEYRAAIFEKFEHRSLFSWSLDLSILKGTPLSLKRALDTDLQGSVFGDVGKGPMDVTLLGVTVSGEPRRLIIS